jgi:hypothetical protein
MSTLNGRSVSTSTVGRQFKKCGIAIRTPSARQKLATRKYADARRLSRAKGRAVVHARIHDEGGFGGTAETARVARRAYLKMCAERRVILKCANSECGKSREFRASEVAALRIKPYRCQPCMAGFLSHMRKIERLATMPMNARIERPDWLTDEEWAQFQQNQRA